MRRAAIVTCISDNTQKELLQRFPWCADKLRIIYNPVDSHIVPCIKNFNADRPRILQVRTGWNKNLARLATALTEIPCHLRIIGQLSEEQKRVLHENHIDYSSTCNLSDDEIRAEYAACDLVSFVSLYEGFGMPILEAQASGRALVTSDSDPMREVAGNGACLADPMDVQSIRSSIMKLIKNPGYRESVVTAGLNNIKRFEAGKIAAQYAAVYREIADIPNNK